MKRLYHHLLETPKKLYQYLDGLGAFPDPAPKKTTLHLYIMIIVSFVLFGIICHLCIVIYYQQVYIDAIKENIREFANKFLKE